MGDRVTCGVEEVMLPTEKGFEVDGVRVVCERCDHEEESFGTHEASIRRCLALMRENCPEGEENFYVAEGDE